jgi:lysophospholipase L1-like esterase/quinol monooxygenase YgiN
MLLFFGDSYVNGTRDPEMLGWCGRLARRLASVDHAVTCYNLGIRGETLPELADRLSDELPCRLRADLAPLAVVSAGTNDTSGDGGSRRVSERDSLAALGRIIGTTRTHAPILVVGPPALPDPEQSMANRDLSARMAALCAEEDVPFVQTWEGSKAATSWIRECAEDDGFHPRAEGYRAMADMIWSTRPWRDFVGLAHVEERPAAEHGAASASAVESEPGEASRERDAPRAQAIIWAFEVPEDRRPAFEAAYGPDGDWARLFRRDEGCLETELLTDDADASRYLTIDRWRSAQDRHRFMTDWASAYRALDGDCEALTSDETLIGTFSVETRAPVGDARRAHDD